MLHNPARGIQLMDMDGKLFALMSLEARNRFGYESETLGGGLSNEDRKHLDGEVRKALVQLGFRAE